MLINPSRRSWFSYRGLRPAIAVAALLLIAVGWFAIDSWFGRFLGLGTFLFTLLLVNILAFIMLWNKEGEMTTISRLAKETLVLVPLGLPFFVPFASSNRTGLSFWPSFALGVFLASITIGLWFRLGPTPSVSPRNDGAQVKGDSAKHGELLSEGAVSEDAITRE